MLPPGNEQDYVDQPGSQDKTLIGLLGLQTTGDATS